MVTPVGPTWEERQEWVWKITQYAANTTTQCPHCFDECWYWSRREHPPYALVDVEDDVFHYVVTSILSVMKCHSCKNYTIWELGVMYTFSISYVPTGLDQT